MGNIRCKVAMLMAEKGYREGRRVTMREVGEAIGVSLQTVSNMAHKPDYTIKSKHLARLCEYFECDVGKILEYVPDKK